MNVADMKEFGRAYRMVSALAALDRRRAAEHQQNLARDEEARAPRWRQRKAEMARLQQAALAARAAADRAATTRSQLIAQIDARRDLTAQLAGELQIAQQRLQQTLGAIGTGAPRSDSEAPLPIRPFRGDLDWPAAGRVMTRFNAKSAGGPSPLQNGIQIGALEGSVAHAVHERHGGVRWPVHRLRQPRDRGSRLADLFAVRTARHAQRRARREDRPRTSRGNDRSRAAWLPGMYFEMRVDGNPVDPLEWLKKRP